MKTDASEHLKQINAALALREIPDYPAALIQLQRARELAPDDGSVYLLLGMTYQDMSQYDGAEESFRKAIEIQPDLLEAQQSLGLLLIRQRKHKEAIPFLRKIYEADPTNLLASRSLSTAYMLTHRYIEAIEIIEKSISIYPDDYSLKEELSRLLSRSGDTKRALEILEDVVKSAPTASNHNRLGMQYINQDEYQKAKEQFTLALKKDETLVSAWFNLARTYLYLKQPDKAVEVEDDGLKQSPENLQLLDIKAYSLSKIGRWRESLDLYDNVIEKTQIDESERLEIVYVRKILVYFDHGMLDDGINYALQILDNHPSFFSLTNIISEKLLDYGRYDQALSILEKISQRNRKSDLAIGIKYYMALVGLNRFEDAWLFASILFNYKKAKTYRTEVVDEVTSAGVDFYQKNLIKESRQVFENALSLEPNSARSTNNMGFIYISQRDWNKALELLEMAQNLGLNEPALLGANRGYVELCQGNFDNALRTLSEGLELAAEGEEVILHVAYPWKDGLANNYADNFPSRWVNIKTSILVNLATCYYYLGDLEKAFDSTQKAIETDNNESTGYRINGCLYFLIGQPEKAREVWNISLQKDISSTEKEVVQQWLNEVSEGK